MDDKKYSNPILTAVNYLDELQELIDLIKTQNLNGSVDPETLDRADDLIVDIAKAIACDNHE